MKLGFSSSLCRDAFLFIHGLLSTSTQRCCGIKSHTTFCMQLTGFKGYLQPTLLSSETSSHPFIPFFQSPASVILLPFIPRKMCLSGLQGLGSLQALPHQQILQEGWHLRNLQVQPPCDVTSLQDTQRALCKTALTQLVQ